MRIVDAQIHLWGSGLPSNMAHRQVTSFTTEEALGLMDEGGVDAAVIHPPGWDPNSTEMAFKARRAANPFRLPRDYRGTRWPVERVHGLLVDELRNPVEQCHAPVRIELTALHSQSPMCSSRPRARP